VQGRPRSGGRRMPRSQRQGRYRSRNTDAVTRKRSLVQIQYGPRDFSKSCLALRVMMGARLLRLCPIGPGHGAGILASTQGVPAVPVSSKPMATDAIECGNHAASRMSRTVNAVRHAHIADSVLEVCLGAIPAWRPYRRFRREAAPRSEGFDWPAPMRYGGNSEPATSAICPCTPDFGAARCADRTCTAGDGRREERSQTGSLVVRRSPRPRQPFQPITTCEHFPGGQALTTRAYGEEGLRARGRHPGGWRRVVHSPVHY
jgi:hypothetical protein